MNLVTEFQESDIISVWMMPQTKFPTQYGFVNSSDWCERECRRIRNNGGGKAFVATKFGMVAVCRPGKIRNP